MHLRSYEASSDQLAVYGLWQSTVGSIWSLPESVFRKIIASGNHQIIEDNGKIIAFTATRGGRSLREGDRTGSILLLMVAPEYQRKGVGRFLLEAAIEQLQKEGNTIVNLGFGAGSYFWPGVPANLTSAVEFFKACGWEYTEPSFDLVMELNGYATPSGIFCRVEQAGIKLIQATPIDAESILRFEAEYFPEWQGYFELPIKNKEFPDVLLARDVHGAILGTALVSDKQSSWEISGIIWQQLLGNNAGAIGCLGVAPYARENGIGLALAARATEILRERGNRISYLGWTGLVGWYGQLGYSVWRQYKMGVKLVPHVRAVAGQVDRKS